MRRGGLALAGVLAIGLAGCDGGSGTPTAQEENLSSVARTPSGLDGADTTGDRTDSLRYQQNQTAGGDPRRDQMGTGAGSPSDGGAIEGGTQNPDVAAPAKR